MYGDMEPNIGPINNKKRIAIIICAVLLLLIVIFGVFNIFKIDSIFRNADMSNYYTAKIHINGANSVEEESVSCKITENGCYVTLPAAIREDGVVLGYSEDKNAQNAKYKMSSIPALLKSTP